MRHINYRARSLFLAAATAILLTPGCFPAGIVDPGGEEQKWTSVTPRAAALDAVGETMQLSILNDTARVPVIGSGITWRAIEPNVVTVDSTGHVEAVSEGTGRIVASTSKHADTATINVNQKVAYIVVTPSAGTAGIGGTQQDVATLRDRNGNKINGRTVTWASSANGIATVSASGLVTGVAVGSAIISAANSGATGTSTITVSDVTPPSTPLNLVASAVGPTQANLSWSGSTDNIGVTGYRVFRNGVQVGTTNGLSFQDVGLTANTIYSFTVAAYDAAGNTSPQSAAASATTPAPADVTPPSTPVNLVATAVGSAQVNLSWSASTDNVGVAGYRIFRGGVQIGTTNGLSFQDVGLTANTTYSYKVAAFDAPGNTSPQSTAASATTPAAADVTPPSTPLSVVATAAGATQVNLSWAASTDNVGVAGYRIFRNAVQVGTASGLSFQDVGLTASTTYSYTVAAQDAAGNTSPQSTAASATTPAAADVTPPSTPLNLVATAAGPTQVNLTWSASTDNVGVTGYRIYRNAVQVGTATTPSFQNVGLTASTTYSYTVAAYDATGNISPQSAAVPATTPAAPDVTPPSTPLNLVATAAGPTQVNLSWSASTDNVGVTGYRIFRNAVQVGTSTTLSFQDVGLTGSTTYSYKIAAYDAAGNTSPQSAAASATTPAAPDVTPPSQPTNVVATAVSPTQVNLTWAPSTDNVAVTGDRIYRNGVQIGTATVLSYQDVGLTPSTTYSYQVAAHDAAGNLSQLSNPVSVTTPAQGGGGDICAGAPAPGRGTVPAGAILVSAVRLASGCASGLVSSGIPLAPGRLTASQLSQLKLVIGGVEQSLYVEALQAPRPDGSLRAVLVEFQYTTKAGTPIDGYLVLGQPRTTTDLARPTTDRGNPEAVVLPTDPAYLVATGLVGPTVTTASTAASDPPGSMVAKYEADFRTYADRQWNLNGAAWAENYYDRAMIYYAWWMRTGEVEYWRRATAMALAYRKDYLEANGYNASAHWLQIEGVELHYLLTGDEASRTAVGREGDLFNLPYYMDNLGDVNGPIDNRSQARVLLALLTAWRLDAPSQSGTIWRDRLPLALTRILATQGADGAYHFTSMTAQCGYNKPFMVGLLNDAMIKYSQTYSADTRIPGAVQRAVDYMWAHDWNPTGRAFIYLDGPCPGYDEGQVPAPDLNNIIVTGFGWTYQQTGQSVYRDHAEAIFAGAVSQAWLSGSKQFNENYTTGFHHLRYRQ